MHRYRYVVLPRKVKGSNHGPAWWIRGAADELERPGAKVRAGVLRRIADAMDEESPVVVLDPERPDTIGRFAHEVTVRAGVQVSFNSMLAAVKKWVPAPPPKPNPPEPTGLGAVVEASCVHNDIRNLWFRDLDGNWHCGLSKNEVPTPDDYASLVGVVVKSEGYAGE